MSVVRQHENRVVATPNATMTTYASPSQGGGTLALWQVVMAPGATGPRHTMDSEQVWTVTAGAATIHLDHDDVCEVDEGDTVVLPADVLRRVVADPVAGVTATVAGIGAALAHVPDADPVVPPWIA